MPLNELEYFKSNVNILQDYKNWPAVVDKIDMDRI